MTVYAFKRRKLLPDGFLKNMLFNVGFMLFVGIMINGSKIELKIDNFGHLGGLITGAVYGLIQIPGDLYKNPTEVSGLTRILGLAALAVFILTCLFSALLLLGIVAIPFPRIPGVTE
jgi:hypothetical protein